MSKQLVIVGSGNHATVIVDAIRNSQHNNYIILSNVDGTIKIHDKFSNRFKYKDEYKFIVGIGDNLIRTKYYSILKSENYELVSVEHPNAIVGGEVSISCGSFIAAGAIIANDVTIGECCIINTNSSIDHHTQIGSFCHIAPGVTVAGMCKIGERCYIGAGATVINNIFITNDVVIGAGGVVTKDIFEPGTYVGVPVRKIN
jgi:sugar O-acyltransferase (sialic acid O-acetyltransferase NeuD family)